jgi:hypothetical protein
MLPQRDRAHPGLQIAEYTDEAQATIANPVVVAPERHHRVFLHPRRGCGQPSQQRRTVPVDLDHAILLERGVRSGAGTRRPYSGPSASDQSVVMAVVTSYGAMPSAVLVNGSPSIRPGCARFNSGQQDRQQFVVTAWSSATWVHIDTEGSVTVQSSRPLPGCRDGGKQLNGGGSQGLELSLFGLSRGSRHPCRAVPSRGGAAPGRRGARRTTRGWRWPLARRPRSRWAL